MQSAELHDRQTFEKVFELHQGVVDGYSLLLQKTEERDKPQNKAGARSLFSACLRKVPDYIQAEVEWRKSIDPDDETDVGAEVYEELENFGSMSGHGWPPLREVVRAHGFKLVHDIIRDRLVSVKTRAELANMPLQHGDTLDSERLALSLAHSLPLKRPFNSTSPLLDGCLASLEDASLWNKKLGSAGTRIRILDSLYSSGKLHITWLATKDMSRMLSESVRSLTSVDPSAGHGHITRFLEVIVTQVLKIKPSSDSSTEGKADLEGMKDLKIAHTCQPLLEATHKTIDSLLTVLTAMSIIFSKQDGDGANDQQDSSQTAAALVECLAMSILMQCHHESKAEVSQSGSESLFATRIKLSILTSALIISIEQGTAAHIKVQDIILGINIVSQQSDINHPTTEDLSNFICNLALCCGQSLSFDAQDILEDLVHSIMAKSDILLDQEKSFLQRLALETALVFAALSTSRKSRVFADKMEQTVKQHGRLSNVSQPKKQKLAQDVSKRGGFRWEEGLCEWIAATPFSSRKQRVTSDSQTSPLPAFVRERHVSSAKPLQDQSFSLLDDGFTDLNDSGYLSMQETPRQARHKTTALILASSPDVLNGEPQVSMPFRRAFQHPAAILARNEKSQLKLHGQKKGEKLAVQSHAPAASKMASASGRHSLLPRDDLAKLVATAQTTPLKPIMATKNLGYNLSPTVGLALPRQAKQASKNGKKASKGVMQTAASIETPTASTPPRTSSLLASTTRLSVDPGVDSDELALSCKKRPLQRPAANPPPRFVKNNSIAALKPALMTGRKSGGQVSKKQVLDESDDELG